MKTVRNNGSTLPTGGEKNNRQLANVPEFPARNRLSQKYGGTKKAPVWALFFNEI